MTITRQGTISLPDKIEAIINIAVPTTTKPFIGYTEIINYYRNMW